MLKKYPEVLAPAGDRERLTAAVTFGADAVYLGGKEFGMRATPQNFDRDQMKEAVDFAHQRGVPVYVTCNTLPSNEEIERLPDYLRFLQACGVDAVIVADIGVLMLCKRVIPEMEIHMSTQTGIVNYLTATELYQMGVKRVVLARELSLDAIREIREKTPPDLEIEAFVHGAMCMSFSGRCLLSSYMAHRDANRGACAQPCRWGYYLMEEKRPGEYYKLEEDERGSYILNAKDLCMIEHIDKLVQAGVTSLKIEGRAKSAYYVSVVTNAYRLAVDAYLRDPEHFLLEDWLYEEVTKVSHRQYSTGFYFGRPEQGQFYENGGYIRRYDVVGVVRAYEAGVLYGEQRNKFLDGDELEVLPPRGRPESVKVRDLRDGEGTPIEAAPHAAMAFSFACETPFPAGSILRKRME
ncbi:peptidase U32 family protein [Zongyangia hominis]|uniref:U32 family peptidase n=1 Tax=Zongyangia hominis TaxID=2763677 RepID=A0A926EG28_9FIRM|nr:U32 family peptidase [Zongyangia hominis]MBC8571181.1 U32 family peptidase [Zongyangia hominis]